MNLIRAKVGTHSSGVYICDKAPKEIKEGDRLKIRLRESSKTTNQIMVIVDKIDNRYNPPLYFLSKH